MHSTLLIQAGLKIIISQNHKIILLVNPFQFSIGLEFYNPIFQVFKAHNENAPSHVKGGKTVKCPTCRYVYCFDQGEKYGVIGDEEGGEPVEECPTCLGFSPHCCQREDGWVLLARLVRHHL